MLASSHILRKSLLAVACWQLWACGHPTATDERNKKVFIREQDGKYTLFREGQPFLIKGAAGFSNLRQLRESGGNTIRTWDTSGLGAILNDAQANGIAVIAGLPMPVSSLLSYYKDTAKTNAQYNAFRDVVNRYRSHPALLMWSLGNEVDFPYKPRFKPFYRAYNRLLEMIHSDDPDHPVTTALINLNKRCLYNIRWKVPGLDLISLNIFGELSSLRDNLDGFSWFWDGPFLISEWGINGPWESEATAWGAPIENTSTKKAEQYLDMYRRWMPVENPRFLGACVFYWGQKQEVTHTWFNLFDEQGAASATAGVMQYIWTGKWPAVSAPAVKYMLVDGKGARDNILVSPGSEHMAEVLMGNDSVHIRWEILKEDWYIRNWYEANTRKPASQDSLLRMTGARSTTFRAPAKEGPYRIFATIYNQNGQFATTNTPFYVVDQP